MKITFLGTGTSQGVPVIACDCEVCLSKNEKDKRLRSSILIEEKGQTIVIDTGPDFRQQMLRENVQQLDAVVFTHEHKDHIAGLDDVRAFNFKQKKDMDIYATPETQTALIREFHYAFAEYKYPGVPQLNLVTIDKEPFEVKGLVLQPIELMHYKMPVRGFRIGDFAYITDANYISKEDKQSFNSENEKWLVSNLPLQEINIESENISIQQSYQKQGLALYRVEVNNENHWQNWWLTLSQKDNQAQLLGHAKEALMPLFNLLANEKL